MTKHEKIKKPLPPLRPGKVWAYLFWPGGRRELRQYRPDVIMEADDAVSALLAGSRAIVGMQDGFYVLDEWESKR